MKSTTKYTLGDMQDIILNINAGISNLNVLHAAMVEADFNGPAMYDALIFVINSLSVYCDQMEYQIDQLIEMEAAHA